MSSTLERTVAAPSSTTSKPIHAWLKQLRVSYVPGETSATMDVFAERLFEQFAALEHEVLAQPEGHIDVLFATPKRWTVSRRTQPISNSQGLPLILIECWSTRVAAEGRYWPSNV